MISAVSSSSASTSSKSFTLVPLDPLASAKQAKASGTRTQLLPKKARTEGPLAALKRVEVDSGDKLSLQCEWENCQSVFDNDLYGFLDHVAYHVTDVPIISTKITTQSSSKSGLQELVDDEDGQKTFGCLWHDCGFETINSGEMIRHINFHSFHTKIKAQGQLMLDETKIEPCSLPKVQRNVLPQLPDCDFICQWANCDRCEANISEPIKFYWHVQWHANEARPNRLTFGSSRKEKCKDLICKWANCTFKASTTFKLKDHLKSHSAERVIACPTCGGLFASRAKFFDHCQRQLNGVESGLKCSYCQKTFPTERLLRDHMRSHINTFQCPLCTMTCPSATSMNKHMTYRHSEERPYACPYVEEEDVGCDYTAKTQHDLDKHLRNVHYAENVFKCNKGCNKMFRNRTALKFHVEKVHENLGPKYCCHLCKKRFRRGNYLTLHLGSVHDYKWPPGHKKFHYAMDENGLYHVQTMRFESFDLANSAFETDEVVNV